ncbi:MAG: diaminopimelate epimerase [Roseivirga sp.]
MRISFYKYQGTGNDFVIVDNRPGELHAYSPRFVQQLCSRRWGVGADGFIVLQNCDGYDFEMIYHNADGSQSLCGNGMRCAIHLAHYLGVIGQEAHLLTTDGAHRARFQEGLIHVAMKDITEILTSQKGFLVNTGSPHYVQWIDSGLGSLDVAQAGSAIRNSPAFQQDGINVNFIGRGKDDSLFVRTYERGVEAETLSCGTGATAAALVAATQGLQSPINIQTLGGALQVSFIQQGPSHFQQIELIGPAQQVYQGTIDMDL